MHSDHDHNIIVASIEPGFEPPFANKLFFFSRRPQVTFMYPIDQTYKYIINIIPGL